MEDQVEAVDVVSEQEQRQQKRKRAHYSCTECTKRKAKCDRALPCAACSARRVPGLCRYLVAGYDDPLSLSDDLKQRIDRNIRISQDISGRLERIEHLFNRNTNDLQEAGGGTQADQLMSGSSNGSSSARVPPLSTAPPRPSGRISEGRYFGSSAMISVHQPAVTFSPGESNQNVSSPLISTHADNRPSRALMDVLHEIPSQSERGLLLDHYFRAINLTRYPIPEEPFMATYRSIMADFMHIPPSAIHFLPLFFIVLAIASLTASPSPPGRHQDTATTAATVSAQANTLFLASRRAAALSDAVGENNATCDLVMSELLTARFLILVRRASDAYPRAGSAVRVAQGIGLHRTGKIVPNLTDEERENRNRMWSYIYHMDRYISLLLGRPLAICDEECDATGPPDHATEPSIVHGFLDTSVDLTSTMQFLAHRNSLAFIMGRVNRECFGLQPAGYEKTMELDQILISWAESLPLEFRILSHEDPAPDYPEANATFDLHSIQRYLLSTEYNFTRIILNRPFLTMSAKTSQSTLPSYRRSLDACYEAAMDDLWARTYYPLPGMVRLSTGSYRITTCAVILGMIMLIDPSQQRLSSIRNCLKNFVRVRRESGALDETNLRESALLELLQSKAEGAMSRHVSPTRLQAPTEGAEPLNLELPAGALEYEFFGNSMLAPMAINGPTAALSPDMNPSSDLWMPSSSAQPVDGSTMPAFLGRSLHYDMDMELFTAFMSHFQDS